jgi:phosphatidylglycerol:prolipoprotein diacylglycerol transferase
MHPVLTVLDWGGVTRAIGTYGALVTLGLLAGAACVLRVTARAELDVGAMIAALAGAVGAGFAGAYLGSLLVLYAQSGSFEASVAQPGVMFYGGAIAGAIGLAGFARAFGLPPAGTLDLALPGLPLAHALGRLGCWFGGCCYGAPCSHAWAVIYTHGLAPAAHPAVPRHPWPLYEAGCLLVLAALFASPRRFAGQPGRRAGMYVALYAIVRLLLEPLRGDSVRGVFFHGTCSLAQLIALATGGAACLFLYRGRRATGQSPLCARSLQV